MCFISFVHLKLNLLQFLDILSMMFCFLEKQNKNLYIFLKSNLTVELSLPSQSK